MTEAAITAGVDQVAATIRDAYAELYVDLNDPATAWAIRVTWLVIANAYLQEEGIGLPVMLAALEQTIATSIAPPGFTPPPTNPPTT